MPTLPLRPAALALVLAAGLLLAACDTDPASSLFDPNHQALPSPVVTSISPTAPPEIVLAGIDEIVITGENFSADLSNNFVYFNAERGVVVEASPTRLRVRVPNLPRADLEIRVMVLGAMEFSNTVPYALTPALTDVGRLARNEEPFAMTADRDGNLYVSLFASNVSTGIKRITPAGGRSDYFSTTFAWSDLALGPDGVLQGVRGVRALFRLPEGGTQQTGVVLPTTTAQLATLTYDEEGAAWTWSRQGILYRIASDGAIREYPMPGTVQDIKAAGGMLYVAITQDGTSRVLRYPVSAGGDLGAAVEVVNVTAGFNAEALSVAAAADGTVFVGTRFLTPNRAHDPVLRVPPGGGAPDELVLYPGVLRPTQSSIAIQVTALEWDGGTGLYATRRFDNPQAAANEPRVTYDIVRIETRQNGPSR